MLSMLAEDESVVFAEPNYCVSVEPVADADEEMLQGEMLVDLLPDSYRIREGMKAQAVYKLPSGMQMSWSGGEVQFRMTGNAQPMTIYLKAGKEMRYVIIDRVGRVRVSLTPPED